MKHKFLLACCAMTLLAGCSSQKKITAAEIDAEIAASNAELERKVGDKVYFAFNEYTLSDNAKEILRHQAEYFKKQGNDALPIVVEGHCDERGTREYNLALGERRAEAVKKYLECQGVRNPITTISFGKERPAQIPASAHDEAAFAANRRAVVVVE